MKRPFLDGLRGKAAWELNRAVLGGVLLIFVVVRLSRSEGCKWLASGVPVVCKVGVLVGLLVTAAYTAARIYRGIVDLSAPRMNPGWLLLEAVLLLAFAITSADLPPLFNIGALAWAAVVFGSGRLFARKRRRRQRRT